MAKLKAERAKLLPALVVLFLAAGRERLGVTAVEYAIIAGVLAAVIVLSVTAIGPELAKTFNTTASAL